MGDVCSPRASLGVFLIKIFFTFLSFYLCLHLCVFAHACHRTGVMSEDSAGAGFLPPYGFPGSNSTVRFSSRHPCLLRQPISTFSLFKGNLLGIVGIISTRPMPVYLCDLYPLATLLSSKNSKKRKGKRERENTRTG